MTILLHDGRRNGHLSWLKDALAEGVADGAILSPFTTPPTPIPRNPSASDVVTQLRENVPLFNPDPEILFDSTTWAATLPGTDQWDFYDQWPLWPRHGRGDLSDAGAIADHVRAVFAIQAGLGVPYLAPTVCVSSPIGPEAELARDLAAESKRQQPKSILTISGTNSFWRAGPTLDTYIGRLARLRAPAFYIVPVRDRTAYPTDLTDPDAIAGWLRTIRSLTIRSRVIAAYTDHLGIVSAVAGADTVGTGWDQGQRTCSPESFRGTEGGGKNVNYSPHPGLLARFTVTAARALQDLAPTFSEAMRWDAPIPNDMRQHRIQHLGFLQEQMRTVLVSKLHADRVAIVQRMFTGAALAWEHTVALGSQEVGRKQQTAWLDGLRSGFDTYVRAER
ncbi:MULTISPECIES: hypothetical protein [Nocardia]|uniref:hypothetical protein n=1 Tax=Nocardia TaxID=1817 RepID=UPI002455D102|nr:MULTISPECIES: hypothetical protein [Nocardia]BDT85486.1 hypothetical protein FMUAM8_12500 [Nocardia cyriacigeorgica]